MRFAIEPAIFDHFPGMHIPAIYAEGVTTRAEHDEIADEWRRVWRETGEVASAHGNAQSHPRVAPWRTRFQAIGVSGKKFPSSIEAMLRRALKGGEPFEINPLVDFYNIVSLRHICPAGGFDVDDLDQDVLTLRFTRDGDRFTALDEVEPEMVEPGEIAYATANDVLTRHFVWRQSRRGLITRDTRRVILLAEVLGEVGPEVAEQILAEFLDGVRRHFVARATGTLTSASQPEVELAL
jgi:DNA/RNA-binding domain of Phe-tRNA-synthetase-like protein